MKNTLRIMQTLLITLLILLFYSCKKEEVPTLTTSAITNITETTASSGGTITTEGSGTVISRGICWSTGITPTLADSTTSDGAGAGTFISNISGLKGASTYYVRAYATNSSGTAFGNDVSFTTNPIVVPTLTTIAVTSITSITAVSGGNITADGGGVITARGACWATTENPTISNSKTYDGSGIGSFNSNFGGLSSGTTYYVRAYATNSAGTAYGTQVSFTTAALTVTDIDGNVYNTVTIGTQVWMKENLKTTKYKDGTAIANVTNWASLTTGAYCWYSNDAATYKATYGALYNWYTVNTGKLCPTGWHVPTNSEWSTLTDYLGRENVAGGKLKESGTAHWASPNTGATNETGFSALPGGICSYNGSFYDFAYYGYWWSSTESDTDTDDAWYRAMTYGVSNVYRNSNFEKPYGFSVRCLMGN